MLHQASKFVVGTLTQQSQPFATSKIKQSAFDVGKRFKAAFAPASREDMAQMPGMIITTSGMFMSSVIALGLAAVGLAGMFEFSTYISRTAKSLKAKSEPEVPPPPKKTLTELIIERKAELELELAHLQAGKTTPESKARAAAIRHELRQYRPHGTRAWWQLW